MESRPPAIEPVGMLDGLDPRAILLGALVDNLATLASFSLLAVWIASPEATSEDREIAEAALRAATATSAFLYGTLVLGFTCTAFAAFLGATRAGVEHLRHGGWIAVASVALASLGYLLPSDQPGPDFPLWYEIVGWVFILPSGLLGGAIAKLRSDP